MGVKWALSKGGSTKILNNVARDPFWYANKNKAMEDGIQRELGLTYLSRLPEIGEKVCVEVLEGPFKTIVGTKHKIIKYLKQELTNDSRADGNF